MSRDDPSFVVTRTLAAPVAAVWRAWVDADLVRRWWGPQGWTCPAATTDVAVGRTSLVAMRGPDGPQTWNRWTYTAVEPLVRLELGATFAHADGTEVAPAALGLPAEFGYRPGPLLEGSRLKQEQGLDELVAAVALDLAVG